MQTGRKLKQGTKAQVKSDGSDEMLDGAKHAGEIEERRRRAYRLWEAAGRPDGRADEFWLKAADGDQPASTYREQTGKSTPIGGGPAGMEQTDDQDNLHNNVSSVE